MYTVYCMYTVYTVNIYISVYTEHTPKEGGEEKSNKLEHALVCQQFSKVSALVYLPYKTTIERTFQNV